MSWLFTTYCLESTELAPWPLRAGLVTFLPPEMVMICGEMVTVPGRKGVNLPAPCVQFIFFLDQRAHTSLEKHCTKTNQSNDKIGGDYNWRRGWTWQE